MEPQTLKFDRPEMLETNLKLSQDQDSQDSLTVDSQIDIVVANLKYYVSLLIADSPPVKKVEEVKTKLVGQLEFLNTDLVTIEEVEKLETEEENENRNQENEYIGFRKLDLFASTIKRLFTLRYDSTTEQEFENLDKIINGFLKEMEVIIFEDNYTLDRLEQYEPEDNNLEKSCHSNDQEVEEIPNGHYWRKEKIGFRAWQPAEVFTLVEPPKHKEYISEVTKVYHDIVPFKIKYVNLNALDEPKINTSNYFSEEIEPEKAVIHCCVPNSKTLITYRLDDIHKLLTIEKEYAQEHQLPIKWSFTKHARTVITPDGSIFGINCRTTSEKQDSSMYEITPEKVSNRGRLPEPKRNSSFIFCNKSMYIMGGNNEKEKCSTKNFKYSLRDKKWREISESNIPLRKPTLCAYKNRYILKFGGLNEFDYISKTIEIYDTTTDKWSIVRANSRNVLEEVQILEDSLAIQINEDQIYVFGGKNSNKEFYFYCSYQTDTGFILEIQEIKEKLKAPAKVSGDLWSVSTGKKNLLSFGGLFSQGNALIHGNCAYVVRSETSKFERV